MGDFASSYSCSLVSSKFADGCTTLFLSDSLTLGIPCLALGVHASPQISPSTEQNTAKAEVMKRREAMRAHLW